jgi:hypothetical protein
MIPARSLPAIAAAPFSSLPSPQPKQICHPERSEGPALALAFRSKTKQICHPERSAAEPKDLRLLLPLLLLLASPLPLLFCLSFPQGICFFLHLSDTCTALQLFSKSSVFRYS